MNLHSQTKLIFAIVACSEALLTPPNSTASLTPDFDSSAYAQESSISKICEGTDFGVVQDNWTDTDEEKNTVIADINCGYRCAEIDDKALTDPIPSRAVFNKSVTDSTRIYESDGDTTISIEADRKTGIAQAYLSDETSTMFATCAYNPSTLEIHDCKKTKDSPLSEEEIEVTTSDLVMGCEGMIDRLGRGHWTPDGSTITYHGADYAKKLLETIKRDAAAIRKSVTSAPQL